MNNPLPGLLTPMDKFDKFISKPYDNFMVFWRTFFLWMFFLPILQPLNAIPGMIQKLGDGKKAPQIFCLERAVVLKSTPQVKTKNLRQSRRCQNQFLNHERYTSLAEQFHHVGYVEICDKKPPIETFDALYAHFDAFIELLQTKPLLAQKLYSAKERFIRTKERHYYSTDFFGFYDESKREARSQIAFYYSTHFHAFIFSHYPEFKKIPEVDLFFEACLQIQKSYGDLFNETAQELGLQTIFSGHDPHPPLLFKVIKYLPSYMAIRPHYDGTAFSLFLDSTDNNSLLLSPYKSSFTAADFFSPSKELSCWNTRNSILLIPGTLLTEFSIYPTPHIVAQSGKTRYATIAFAMRPYYTPQKIAYSPLPNFND